MKATATPSPVTSQAAVTAAVAEVRAEVTTEGAAVAMTAKRQTTAAQKLAMALILVEAAAGSASERRGLVSSVMWSLQPRFTTVTATMRANKRLRIEL